jgi:hypothetical protein
LVSRRRQIDDREAAVPERDAFLSANNGAGVIWPAVAQRIGHACDHCLVEHKTIVEREDACDATHALSGPNRLAYPPCCAAGHAPVEREERALAETVVREELTVTYVAGAIRSSSRSRRRAPPTPG